MIKDPWACLLVAMAVAVAGCQAYRAQPLTTQSVEQALQAPQASALTVESSRLHHALLPPVTVDLKDGLSPDEAAVIAVLINPSLRSARDRRGLADAQLLQAGLLPNPQLSGTLEPVTGGNTVDTVNAYSYDVNWDINGLITRRAKLEGARANLSSVELDIAWQEWQVAQAARLAAYKLLSLREQAGLSTQMKDRLAENLGVVRKAVNAGLMTELDQSAAEAADNQAQANLTDLQKQFRQQQLALNQAVGLPPDAPIPLQQGIIMPSRVERPSQQEILRGLEQRRLDLVALRQGYDSQEAAVRVAILEQFPKINIGLGSARDTSDVITMPLAVTVDIPIFDRNQGAIVQERATRRQLYDEYVNRIFETRSEIAKLIDNAEGIEKQLNVAEAAIPSLHRLVETYHQAVDRGQADVLSYYTAWNELTAKRLEIIGLKQQLIENQIALQIAAGDYDLESIRQGDVTTQPAVQEVNE